MCTYSSVGISSIRLIPEHLLLSSKRLRVCGSLRKTERERLRKTERERLRKTERERLRKTERERLRKTEERETKKD